MQIDFKTSPQLFKHKHFTQLWSSYFTIPHGEKGHYFSSTFKDNSTTSKGFEYSPEGHKEDLGTSELSKVLSPRLLLMESGVPTPCSAAVHTL